MCSSKLCRDIQMIISVPKHVIQFLENLQTIQVAPQNYKRGIRPTKIRENYSKDCAFQAKSEDCFALADSPSWREHWTDLRTGWIIRRSRRTEPAAAGKFAAASPPFDVVAAAPGSRHTAVPGSTAAAAPSWRTAHSMAAGSCWTWRTGHWGQMGSPWRCRRRSHCRFAASSPHLHIGCLAAACRTLRPAE